MLFRSEAIIIAIIGLIVNSVCILIMGGHQHHIGHKHNHEHEDYNFKSAYMHILADAMTSVFAISALFAGKYLGWIALDPIVGFLGGTVICIWAYNLIKSTTAILIDTENKSIKNKIIESLKNDIEFTELLVWNTSEDKVSIVGKYKTITKIKESEIESKIKTITEFDKIVLAKII